MDKGAECRLVFSGEILEGFQSDEVKLRFGQTFKMQGAQLDQVFSGQRTVLKRSLPVAEARRYVVALSALGVSAYTEPLIAAAAGSVRPAKERIRLHQEQPHSSERSATTRAKDANIATPATPIEPTATVTPATTAAPEETITCPNCGEVQRKQLFCRSCTTNMPMGIAAKKEDAERARAERQDKAQAGRFSRGAHAPRAGTSSDRVDPPSLLSLSFEGRMGRMSYFNAGGLAILGIALLGIGAAVFLLALPKLLAMILMGAAGIVFMVWMVRITVLRLHDFNRSGWWVLLLFIPYLGVLANIAMALIPGSAHENDYGEKPRTGNWLLAVLVALAYVVSLFAYLRLTEFQEYLEQAISAGSEQQQSQEMDPQALQTAALYLNSPAALAAYSEYAAEAQHKAFAVGGGGAFGWHAGKNSVNDAMTKAMQACTANRQPYTAECHLVNVNDQWPQ